MTEPRVLVVDDEEGPREAIRMILKPRYQVFTAGERRGGAGGSCRGLRPDVIFMDVKMPRMDGVQLLERVKAVDPVVEVVMITAYASLDTVQRAMRFGAMDYLVKPFAPRELQEAAERALARRRQRADGPGGALAPLIGKMRDLAQRRDPRPGQRRRPRRAPARHAARGPARDGRRRGLLPGHRAGRGRALGPARRGAATPSPRPGGAPLGGIREPLWLRPGAGGAWPLPWPTELDALGFEAAVRRAGRRRGAAPRCRRTSRSTIAGRRRHPDPGPRRPPPVTDLMVTAVRTSALLTAAARQAAEQSLRAVQGEILRQISTAVLVDPALDRTLAAITDQLQQGAGYERVAGAASTRPSRRDGDGRPRRLPPGRAGPAARRPGCRDRQPRDLDPSERDLLRMFSESVALIVRNANLHRELSEAKSFLENLIQSATESIVAVDPAGRVVTWNPAAERMFGRAAATRRAASSSATRCRRRSWSSSSRCWPRRGRAGRSCCASRTGATGRPRT